VRTLTLRELNRALLARQLLLQRARLSVPRAIERLCALQAQYPPSPYIALWSRLVDFQRGQLTRAIARRQVVKATLFRMTLHLTSARDYPALAGVWHASRREQYTGLSPRDVARLARRLEDALAAGPQTHVELTALAQPELAGREWQIRGLTPLVHLPSSSDWGFHGQRQLVSGERWLRTPLGERVAGAELLVRRHLGAFGPATREDLLRFAGLRAGDLRPALEALPLRRFGDERGRVLLDLPRQPLPAETTPAPLRFLPKWDSALLAYEPTARDRILPERYRKTVIAVNGDVLPTFLVDGFVAGAWAVERSKRRATLVLEPFEPLPASARSGLVDEGERLVRFVEPDAPSFSTRFGGST
jgi:hypothetical protein